MRFLDQLERRFGRFAIPNLALYLVIGQVFVFLTALLGLISLESLDFAPALVLEGRQWWRIVTFLFIVPIPGGTLGFVFTAFGWYIFYLMSNALEHHWGAFRFNVYLLLSYVLTVALSFFAPLYGVTNLYILGSVFLAFAYLNPDFELLLFFILPVKIKWLALIAWAFNLVQFIRGDLSERLQIGASVVSFFVFFGPDMVQTLRQGRRVATRRAEREAEESVPRHVCHVCGKTDRTHPDLDFRYCSKCAGDQCYCPEHIHNHSHVVDPDGAKSG
ncbi:MAG: hypothetical protein HZC55_06940 [Verrucomicrobia bacterium]|nr:hypothetical protein [Verrucomicrobiota bacterium]